MTKGQKLLFTVQHKKNNYEMRVDNALYNHFQTLTPDKKKAVQDMMTLKLLKKHLNE